ncbi:MAG TPA: LCP family protein, partial [Anaerolineales bacterium]|nr:LCP family protein [Anaerolineales bacterium]
GKWGEPAIPIPPPAPEITMPEGTLNVVLLGSDRRSGSGFRTDTIVIASIQPAQGLVTLVSIPRDLYVYLPGNSVNRINTAWIYGASLGYPGGGPQLLFDTIRYNLGIHVDRYALVEMDGFRRIIDILGGIDVRVACPYTDWRLRRPELPQQLESSWALFTAPQGIVHMNGDYALWYARSRQRSSDFDRSRRQQEVLRAAYREALRPDVLARIPELYRTLQASVVTNLTLEDVLQLAPVAVQLEPAHLRSRFIGRPQVTSFRVPKSGAAVLLPKADVIQQLLTDALTTPVEELAEPRLRIGILPTASGDLPELARERLLYAGFDAELLSGEPLDVATTQLQVPPEAAPETVASVLRALGLPHGAVAAVESVASPQEFRLAVGRDYSPCFDPNALTGFP